MYEIFDLYRCKSFQTAKRGEICRIPGCSVSPSAPGTPIPIRLPQVPPETFKQFMLYVYTGKVTSFYTYFYTSLFLKSNKQDGVLTLKIFHVIFLDFVTRQRSF